jgi:hypothetical protein
MVRSQQDFFSGLLFLTVGTVFAWSAGQYEMGTASYMGPGYYPRLLGILCALVGFGVIAKSILKKTSEEGSIGPWAWKELTLVIAANLFFGVAIGGLPSIGLPPLGLAIGVYGLVLIASLASGEFKLREYVVLATILMVGVYLICVKILTLYVPLWPQIFGQ